MIILEFERFRGLKKREIEIEIEIEHGSSRHLGNNPAHPISISSHECNICRSNNDLIQLINPNNKRRVKKYKQRKKK